MTEKKKFKKWKPIRFLVIKFIRYSFFSEDDKPYVLAEAESKFGYIRRLWKTLAFELRGQDPYQYLRAYTGGNEIFLSCSFFSKWIDPQGRPTITEGSDHDFHTGCPYVCLAQLYKSCENHCRPDCWAGWVEHCRLLSCTAGFYHLFQALRCHISIGLTTKFIK